MNKRKYKKKLKKIALFTSFDDCIPKCYTCENYEFEDFSVGLLSGCLAPQIYDKNDEIIQKMDDKVTFHMQYGGYACPYYIKNKKSKYVLKKCKSWKEYKIKVKRDKEYWKKYQ